MIKNTNTAIAVSGVVSLIFGGLAVWILGTESWIMIGIELAVVIVSFIFAISILPQTTQEIAESLSQERRIAMVDETNDYLQNIKDTLSHYQDPSVTSQVREILSVATTTYQEILKPGNTEDKKLGMLHEYLEDFAAYFSYIQQVSSGMLLVENPTKEINDFRADLPGLVRAFKSLKVTVNATEAAMGRVHRRALKMKLENDGMTRTTLDDINNLSEDK